MDHPIAKQWAGEGLTGIAVVSKPQLRGGLSGLDQGFARFVGPPPGQPERTALEAVEIAIEELDRHVGGERGVFLWLHASDLARVDLAPEYLVETLRERVADPANADPVLEGLLRGSGSAEELARRIEEEIGRKRGSPSWQLLQRAAYDARLFLLDRALGRLVDSLEERGAWREAVFCLTSTRGCYLTEPRPDGLREGFSEALIRIPLILKKPRSGPDFVELEAAYSSMDVIQLLDSVLPWYVPDAFHSPTMWRSRAVEVESALKDAHSLVYDGHMVLGRGRTSCGWIVRQESSVPLTP